MLHFPAYDDDCELAGRKATFIAKALPSDESIKLLKDWLIVTGLETFSARVLHITLVKSDAQHQTSLGTEVRGVRYITLQQPIAVEFAAWATFGKERFGLVVDSPRLVNYQKALSQKLRDEGLRNQGQSIRTSRLHMTIGPLPIKKKAGQTVNMVLPAFPVLFDVVEIRSNEMR